MRIISKLKIHPLYYVVAFICVITGNFRPFVIVNALILVHEIGHILAGTYFKWNIERIVLLPFGGMTIFNEKVNRPIKEEFIIALMGPIFQILFFHIIQNRYYMYTSNFHYGLLFFNLLPIIPLDGSKILSCILNLFFSLKSSQKILVYISFFNVSLLFFYSIHLHNLILFILILFLLKEIYKYLKMQPYVFYKFLLERYMSFYIFPKTCYIDGIHLSKMKRNVMHMFYIEHQYKSERQVLKQFFTNQNKEI